MSFFSFNKTPVIEEDKIVQEWSQLVLQMGNKGAELLKRVEQKIQELNLPNTTLMRKEATLGPNNNRNEFGSVKHDKEEFGVFMSLIHQATTASLEEVMNDLNLDFSKVNTHSEGFLNL